MKNKKKYLSFEDLRVAYAPKDDVVEVTSGDPELAASGWRLVLQKHTLAERTLRSKLEAAGLLRLPTVHFPEVATYPEAKVNPWHAFPLGVNGHGEEVALDVREAPHTWLVGATGTGKSIAIRGMLTHVAQNLQRWEVTGVDLMRVELGEYARTPLFAEAFTHATTMDQAIEAAKRLRELMFERYAQMEEHDFRYLERIDAGLAKAQLLLFDEAYVAFSPDTSGVTNKISINWNQRRDQLVELVTEIARLGRAAGIFVVIATQRADEKVYPASLLNQLDNRILLGKVVAPPRGKVIDRSYRPYLVLDYIPQESGDAPRGRGAVNLAGRRETVQFYWVERSLVREAVLGKLGG